MPGSFRKIFLFQLGKALNILPISLAFSVTRKCNLSCKTCNIWKEDGGQELSLAEYSRVFSSIKGRVPWLTFDGGEPFLRDDFDQIVINAYRCLKPAAITIATNGSLPGMISAKVQEIAGLCPHSQIIVNLSLDDIGERHDAIRNTKGVFAKASETYRKLKCIDKANLCVGINTTLSRFNIANLPEIIGYCLRLEPDSYLVELAEEREMFGNLGSDLHPDKRKCVESLDFILSQISEVKFKNFSALTQVMRKEYYRLIKRNLREKRQIIPCLAGIAFGHIFANGEVWSCSVKRNLLGNLRQENYDFRKLWHSARSNALRRKLFSSTCYCTSANANYTNMISAPRILPKLMLGYLSWKRSVLTKDLLNFS